MTKRLLIEIESYEQVKRAVSEVRSILRHNPTPSFIQTDLTPLLKLLDSLEAATKPFTVECPECGEEHDVTLLAGRLALLADRYGERCYEIADDYEDYQVSCECGETYAPFFDVESFVTKVS